MKKVLLLAPQPFYTERGTPIAILNLASALTESGYQLDLLTFPHGHDVMLEHAVITRVGAWLPLPKELPVGFSFRKLMLDFLMLGTAIKMCRKNDYQILHGVEEASFIALAARVFVPKHKRPKVIYDMDSSMSDQLVERWPKLLRLHRLFDGFEAFAIARVDHVLAVCQALKDKAEQHKDQASITVIEDISDNRQPHFSKLENLSKENVESSEDNQRVDDLGQVLPNCQQKILYVGNLEHYQGVGLVLDAMAELKAMDSQAAANIGFIVIGGRAEDIARYQQQAKTLGIADCVAFLGPRPVQHLAQYLRQADALVSPRLTGLNTPMKIYTYLGAGKPIIATNIYSHTQVLNDDNAAMVAPDAKAMAAGIQTLFASSGRMQKIAKAAALAAENNYSYARFKQRIADFYQQVLA